MQIVIKISEEDYKNVSRIIDMGLGTNIDEAIKNGIPLEQASIPYIMHKEMDIPISECQKAYDVAIDYLRSQGKLKG